MFTGLVEDVGTVMRADRRSDALVIAVKPARLSVSELAIGESVCHDGACLTVTDTGMMRFWITGAHAALVLAHGALLAADGEVLSTPHDPAELSVGELAQRIWRAAGAGETADIELLGIRRGETLRSLLRRLIAIEHRWPWLLPTISFAAGWVGFLLVRRGEGALYVPLEVGTG